MIIIEPTERDLRNTFNRVMSRIDAGELGACPSDTGLDPETETALDDYAAGRITADEARAELELMINGAHAAATRARYARMR